MREGTYLKKLKAKSFREWDKYREKKNIGDSFEEWVKWYDGI